MPRIACRAVIAAAAVSLAWGEAVASPRHEHRVSSPSSHSHRSTPRATSQPRAAGVAPIVVHRVVPVYSSTPSYASRQPLTFSRTATPPAYYAGAISPNAPPFSFSPSEEHQPGWGWQRVSYQQLDTEVRARRAARAQEKAQGFRQYCPDSRAYYPDVVRCDSEWLNVVSKSTVLGAAQ